MISAQNSLTGIIAGILQLLEADVMMGTVADVLPMGAVGVVVSMGSTVRSRAAVSNF
jgi:translation initiation factor 6 (eIF-6)